MCIQEGLWNPLCVSYEADGKKKTLRKIADISSAGEVLHNLSVLIAGLSMRCYDTHNCIVRSVYVPSHPIRELTHHHQYIYIYIYIYIVIIIIIIINIIIHCITFVMNSTSVQPLKCRRYFDDIFFVIYSTLTCFLKWLCAILAHSQNPQQPATLAETYLQISLMVTDIQNI